MTVKKAIAQIEPVAKSSKKVSIALETALLALEKQMPKEPKVLKTHTLSGYKYGICCCGEHIMDDEKYCSNCGQAIEWGEKETTAQIGKHRVEKL